MIRASLTTLLALMGTFAMTAQSAHGTSQKAPDFELRASSANESSYRVTALPPEGHHVNVQAPITAEVSGQALTPESVDAAGVRFTVPADTTGTLTVSLYVCDDAGTFCEKHAVSRPAEVLARAAARSDQPRLTGSAKPKVVVTARPTAGSKDDDLTDSIVFESSSEAPPPPSTDEHGFLLNEPQLALALAKKENKPLLIDFYGIWCPPCNEYDEEVFVNQRFRKATAGFVKLKLDADSPVSWALKSRFKIGGYPTIIFASSTGDEISRVVGFRAAPLFLAEVAKAYKSKDEPLAVLLARADKGEQASALKIGRTMLERAEYESAVRYLQIATKNTKRTLPDVLESLFSARVGLLEKSQEANAETQLTKLLETALKELPASPASLEWRSKLADLYQGQKKADARTQLLSEQIKACEALVKQPKKLEGYDLTVADVLGTIAETYESLGKADEAKAAWKKTAAEYGRRISLLASERTEAQKPNAAPGPGGVSERTMLRGYNLERAYALWKSGDTASAEALYTSLEKKYPVEFTFYFAHSKMNLELKRYPEAQALAARALEHSYGDNRLRVAETLAKALKAQDRNAEARAVIRDALTGAKLPEDSSIRTHRYANALRKLEKDLGPADASAGT